MQNPAELLNAAHVHHREGRLADAIALYRELLAAVPGDVGALGGLGAALRASGDTAGAVDILERACRDHPDEPALHNNLGNALAAAGQWMAAEASYVRALELKPDYLEALGNLGGALGRLGDHASAAETFEKAAELRPDLSVFAYEAGRAWRRAGDAARAAECLRRALALEPERADIVNDLGNAVTDTGDLDGALHLFSRAVELAPTFMEARFNRANTLRAQGRLADALADYDAALALAPEHAEVRWNRALTLLLMERWEDGLRDYAWRWRRQGAVSDPLVQVAKWRGEPDAAAHLLIASEQGYGDTLQFARYLPAAARRVGRVTFSCPPPLVELMASAFPDIEVTASAPETLAADAGADAGASLLDLPGLLWPDVGMATADAAYLAGGAAAAMPRRIGLVWRGNPSQRLDSERSIPLSLLAPLARTPGVEFHSLQLGGGEEIRAAGLADHIADATAELTDFAATRRLLAGLDLVIGVDTAVLHLAGAMGVPAWLLLARVPDWRWGADGDKTPWYPVHRLIRQAIAGDWSAPVQTVEDLLLAALDR